MNRYRLRANYEIQNIDSRRENGTVIVDVPMLSADELRERYMDKILGREKLN